jgi:2,3-bisphosphoglycerate-dependent phosphoglycerate mutase
MPGVPSAHQPYPLNAKGQIHAEKAAGIINEVQQQNGWSLVAKIDCSQMLRAWQTAHIIADNLTERASAEPQVKSFDELAERCVGSAANLTARQIEKVIHDDPRYAELPENWKSNSKYRLPLQGAESLLEAGERVADHLVRRMYALPDSSIDRLKLFVGHGAAFRHAAFHLGVLEYDDIARLSMYHGRPVFLEYFDDGCWSHLAGEWKIRATDSAYID